MIKTVNIKNFRNHQQLELEFYKQFIYLYGDNGVGKTSVLESIYFAATTKSHRTNDANEMIRKQEQFAVVKIKTNQDKFEVVLSKTGKRASINGVEKRRMSDFIGHLKVVLFAPEDLDLIKGTPSTRRQFLDLEWMQLNKNYLRQLNQYKQILKQRNMLLKKIKLTDDYTFLDILGEQLYDVGIEIMESRKKFLERLNQHLEIIYPLFANHQIKLFYQPDVNDKQFRNHLKKNQKQDIIYQNTLAGPHRDDFSVDFNGFEAKGYTSQGETRLIVIALKLALLKVIEEETKQPVVLLLDDVLSELDQDKQKIFLENLPQEHQIIMTSVVPIDEKHIQKIYLPKERNK